MTFKELQGQYGFLFLEPLIDFFQKSLFIEYIHHEYSLILSFSLREKGFLPINLWLTNDHFSTYERDLMTQPEVNFRMIGIVEIELMKEITSHLVDHRV